MIDTNINNFRDNIYPSILINLRSGGQNISEIQIVSARSVRFSTNKSILETEEDVDKYSNDFKEALKNEIRRGKKGFNLMDTNALKKFAQDARQTLKKTIATKLKFVLSNESLAEENQKAITELENRISR